MFQEHLTASLRPPCLRVAIQVASYFTFLGMRFARLALEFFEEWPGASRTQDVCRPT
jgi:hypothetical protein